MDFDLNALAEQLDAKTDSTPTPDASPTPQATPDPTPVPDTVATDSSNDVIEVDLPDGTKEAIKRSELPNYILRQKDYTRKTQQLAAKAKQYEAFEQNAGYIRQQLEFADQMAKAIQEPEQLFGYLIQQLGPENAVKAMAGLMKQNPEQYDPNDIPTYQEADKLIQSKLSAYEQRMQELEQRFAQTLDQRLVQERQQLQQERSDLELKKQEEEYSTKFQTVLDQTFQEYPKLRAIDMGEDLIRFKVATKIQNFFKLNGVEPSFETAAQWMKDAAKEQVTKLETEFNIQRANSPLNNGIEPPGGSRPVSVNTQPKSHYNSNTGETDWDQLLADTTARIKGLSRL